MRTEATSVIVIAVLALLLHPEVLSGQSAPKVRSATKAATNSNPKVTVSNKFTQDMADQAGLDTAQPALSSDGLHSGVEGQSQKVASAECLFAETLVNQLNKSLNPHAIAEYCDTMKTSQAKQFEATFPTNDDKTSAPMKEALIHIVQWDNNGQWSGVWYQYERTSGKGVLLPLSRAGAVTSPPDHLLAKGGVGFLAIHLNIDDSCGISYDIKSTHTKPINQQDVADLISLAEGYYAKAKGAAKDNRPVSTSPGVGVWGGQLILSLVRTPSSIVFTPSLKTSAKVHSGTTHNTDWATDNTCNAQPSPAQAEQQTTHNSLKQKMVPVAIIESREETAAMVVLSSEKKTIPQGTKKSAPPADGGGGTADSPGNTNGKPASANPGDATSLSGAALTVPDEGLHWWDVSVAMPVTSYNKLTFDSTNNLVTVKNTNDIKPYALFDVYPFKTDLSLKNAISRPMISAGIPMSSTPLQKPFVGLGLVIGIKSFRFQPVVGLRIEKDVTPMTLSAGQSATPAMLASDLHSQWHAKLQVMIGFSIGDAKKVLGLK
jgi:hypothetical protein